MVVIVVGLLAWAGGYHYANRQKDTPPAMSLRIVNGTMKPLPSDFSAFLTADITKADKTKLCSPGFESYSVLNVYNDSQAKLIERCNDLFPIDAKKVNGSWQFLSITNNFPDYDFPTCAFVGKYDISSHVEPYCLNTGVGETNVSLQAVTNP